MTRLRLTQGLFLLIGPVGILAPKAMVPLLMAAGAVGLWRWVKDGRVSDGWNVPVLAVLAAFLVWAVASALWSIDPMLSVTRALIVGGLCLSGLGTLYLVRRQSKVERQSLRRYFLIGFAAAVAGLAAAWIYIRVTGDTFTGSILSDPLTTLNNGAASASLLIWPVAAILWTGGRRKSALAVVAAMAAALTLFSSAAALLALVAGVSVVALFMVGGRKLPLLLGPLVAVGILAAPMIVDVLPEGASGSLTSAQHRVLMWRFVAQKIDEKPVLGWGMNTARAIDQEAWRLDAQTEIMPLHPHNAPLQVRLELGLPGALLFAGFVMLLIVSARPKGRPDAQAIASLSMLTGYIAIAAISYGVWQSWWIALAWMLAVTASLTREPHIYGATEKRSWPEWFIRHFYELSAYAFSHSPRQSYRHISRMVKGKSIEILHAPKNKRKLIASRPQDAHREPHLFWIEAHGAVASMWLAACLNRHPDMLTNHSNVWPPNLSHEAPPEAVVPSLSNILEYVRRVIKDFLMWRLETGPENMNYVHLSKHPWELLKCFPGKRCLQGSHLFVLRNINEYFYRMMKDAPDYRCYGVVNGFKLHDSVKEEEGITTAKAIVLRNPVIQIQSLAENWQTRLEFESSVDIQPTIDIVAAEIKTSSFAEKTDVALIRYVLEDTKDPFGRLLLLVSLDILDSHMRAFSVPDGANAYAMERLVSDRAYFGELAADVTGGTLGAAADLADMLFINRDINPHRANRMSDAETFASWPAPMRQIFRDTFYQMFHRQYAELGYNLDFVLSDEPQGRV
ncbi:MAG: O-antigen ligase family protein [Alphaproteobacteria bacterium]